MPSVDPVCQHYSRPSVGTACLNCQQPIIAHGFPKRHRQPGFYWVTMHTKPHKWTAAEWVEGSLRDHPCGGFWVMPGTDIELGDDDLAQIAPVALASPPPLRDPGYYWVKIKGEIVPRVAEYCVLPVGTCWLVPGMSGHYRNQDFDHIGTARLVDCG